MPRKINPTEHPTFITMKSIATGGGEHGPHFDRGVLAVLMQIEANRMFTPNPSLRLLRNFNRQVVVDAMTDDERNEAIAEAKKLGMNVLDASEYSSGACYAEDNLSMWSSEN